MNSVAIELLAPRYPIAWYPWAVQYFFLIALSYATLWLAAPALIFGKKDWLPTARLALLACLSAGGRGLLLIYAGYQAAYKGE